VAQPLRFRFSPESWDEQRVRQQLLQSLRENIGARSVAPRFEIGGDWETYRFEMTNGDLALFASGDEGSYWMGNTETPEALWRTNKHDWDDVPYPVARWAQRELLATLYESDPWLEAYPYLSWFFLPVFMSKDGRESTRTFFREYAAGFPNTDWQQATQFVEDLLATGVMDEYRYLMAGKLGTSTDVDHARMNAAMGEFIAAKILDDAGYEITPEIEVTTGHSLDYRASNADGSALVEVTRPVNPRERAAGDPVAAVRDTASTKTSGQLSEHGGGAVLFVDCSSFDDEQWQAVADSQPAVGHRPAVVYRVRPTGHVEGYQEGTVPLDLDGGLEFIDD
jgi:hypothetical protein